MSLRHDRIDNFWFVLRHEIEHVLRQHGRSAAMLDTELEGERALVQMRSPRKNVSPTKPPPILFDRSALVAS